MMNTNINLVIPAAGSATRLRPLSKNTSKIMVRVNGKPCLDYIVEQARKVANVKEIVIVDGEFDDIREYCAIRHPDIKLVKQGSLNGPRDAIKVGINELDNPELPLAVWLGDAIILENDMPLGTDFLLSKDVVDQTAWCMWDGDSFYNKPSHKVENAVALVGLYSFKNGGRAKESFNAVDDYDISAALEYYADSYDRIITNLWYDIGELSTYYKTCAELLNLKSREFNNMEYNPDLGTIRKSPNYHDHASVTTLYNEKNWYKNLNQEQYMFVPKVLETTNDLVMSYESGTLLSDLMLYENLSVSAWEYIIDKVLKVKTNYFNNRCEDLEFIDGFPYMAEGIWVDKTQERLKNTPILLAETKSKLENIAFAVCKKTRPISGMHGDLHFGNILYNQQTDQIKLFDPRGNYGQSNISSQYSHIGILGDDLYDYCKLAHDVYHGYNAMVSNVKHNEEVKEIFVAKLKEHNLPVDLILAGGLLLLATCIPLHYDDEERQTRFANYVENNVEKYSV